MKKTTQKEIADKLGLHVRTVSRVLNNADSVKADTRQRVINELNKNGYFFNTHTRSEEIAVDIQSGYLERNALQLIEMLSHRDLHFRMTNHKKDLRHFYKTIAQCDSLIFCSTPSAQIIEEAGLHCPGIYRINLFSHGVPGAEVSIEPDNDVLAKRSARYLADCGHRHILVITTQDSVAMQERTKSFVGEMTVSHPECLCQFLTAPLDSSLTEKIVTCLKELSPRPTAVYCPGIFSGWHAEMAFEQLKLSVPGDISLLTNDLPDEFAFDLPFRPDTIFSRISDILELAQFHIINRFMLRNAGSVIVSPGTNLQINGSVAKLKKESPL